MINTAAHAELQDLLRRHIQALTLHQAGIRVVHGSIVMGEPPKLDMERVRRLVGERHRININGNN